MGQPTYGTMGVDWEQRIDFDRLRVERLQRAKDLLAKSEMGALLCFDMNNVRYLTSTHIGTWAQDKANRFVLLPQNDEPVLWDFGSAARHHQLHCPWLGERSRPGISMLRGTMSPEHGRAEDVAKKIRIELEMRGLHKEPVGIDIIELPVLFALQREGITVIDGQQLMSEARVIKTKDEIALLNTSASMVDAAYHDLYMAISGGNSLGRDLPDQLPHALQPGIRSRPCLTGRVDGRDHENRSLGVLGAQGFHKWSVDLGEGLHGRVILGEIHHEAGSIDTRDGIRQFRLAHPISRKSEIDKVDVEDAPENGLIAHSGSAGATTLRD